MATADVMLPVEPSTLFYYLEVKDGGIIQTYPGTAFEKRRKHVPHDVNIRDLRSIKDDFTLDRNGFQLVNHTPKVTEWSDKEHVKEVYYPECEALFKSLFDEAQSDAAAKGDKEFVTKNNPARFVHCDQSYRGAEQILFLNLDEEEASRRLKKRWAVMNVWQPIIRTVTRDPLAFCDYQTLDENDFRTVVANLPPPGAGGEYGDVSKNLAHKPRADYSSNGDAAARYEVTNMAYNSNQRWYYASDQTTDEAWVFKIFDSKTDGRARCAVHSSFPLESQTDSGPPRESIEVRAFLFWDDE